jgi:hypothetical protein
LFEATTTKFCAHNGKISNSVTVPDNHTELRALGAALKLYGAYISKKSADVAHPGTLYPLRLRPTRNGNQIIEEIRPSPLCPRHVVRFAL